MKKSKILILTAVILLVVCVTVVAVSATLSLERATEIITAIVNNNTTVEQDLNGDGKVNVLDAILAVKSDNFTGPKLTSLTFDDSDYSVQFDAYLQAYTVQLPAGRPRIPAVVATAEEGLVIGYDQATISDTESFGYAKVVVSDGSDSNTYTVKFERAEVADSIALQYADRWTFTPDYELSEGEAFVFTSTDNTVASVDENGVITAANVSDTAVTITAKVGETEVDTLTISKIDKAKINLFFVTGQSNAHGCYDFADTDGSGVVSTAEKIAQANAQLEDVIQPDKAGQVYIYDAQPMWNSNSIDTFYKLTDGENPFYDLHDVKRAGFASALGKTYYDLSGEKVVFLHTAYNGSCIEKWLDPVDYPELAEADFTNTANYNYYVATQEAYAKLMEILDEELYDINHRANFWLQGETCMSRVWGYAANDWTYPSRNVKLFSDEDYADMFTMLHGQMKDDFAIEANNIVLVRAHGSVVSNADSNVLAAINNVRAAQYGLANSNSEINLVSRFSDYTVRDRSKYVGTIYEPYIGTMGVSNVHYNQTGHNINGIYAATNYFKSIDVDTVSTATKVEIINTDGIERLGSDTLFEIQVGKTKRVTAFALPEYSLENVTWSSSDESVAVVNKFGLITVVGTGDAVIKATADNGVYATINVKGIERTTEPKVFDMRQDQIQSLYEELPEFSFEDITYTSSNEDIATVSDKGLITATGAGQATITAKSITGAYETFIVNGTAYSHTGEAVHYRWDFDSNLSSSADANDLYVSDSSIKYGAHKNYSISNGIMTVKDVKSGVYYDSPEFRMTYPVRIDDNVDWTIEWKARLYGGSAILGQEHSTKNFLYAAYNTPFSENEVNPIRLVPNEGGSRFIEYGDYAGYNNPSDGTRNTWKLDYKSATKTLSFWIYLDGDWVLIGEKVGVEPFSAKFTNIGGRYTDAGTVNFRGEWDYLDIKVGPAVVDYEDQNYKWDFVNGSLASSEGYDENNLTITELSSDATATFDESEEGIITIAGADKERANYQMDTPVVLTRDYDWSIKWRSKMTGGSVLLGQETNSLYKNCLYAAYSTGATGYEYGLKLDDDYGNTLTLPYAADKTSAVNLNENWNTWRLSYTTADNKLVLERYDDTLETPAWVEINSINPKYSQFEKVTFNTLFGRFNENGLVSFRGSMDYMEISTKTPIYEVVYDWDFSSYESTAIENTLTPGATSGTLSSGIYTTTTRGDELALQVPITLDSTKDWSIEWSAAAASSSYTDYSLLATDKSASTYNHIYFSPNAYNAIVFKSAAGTEFAKLSFATEKATTKTLSAASNTWKIEYKHADNALSIQRWDSTNEEWIEKSYLNPPAFSMELSHMFGDFGSSTRGDNWVNFHGTADYMTVKYTVSK